MRRTPLILALSLAANAVLAVVLWPRIAASFASTSGSSSTPGTTSLPPASAPRTDSGRWQEISTLTDDTAFVSQLRASGFPPHVVLALTRQRITARYAAQFRELKQKTTQKPYWQTSDFYESALDLAGRAAQRALHREIHDTLKSLLGADAENVSDYVRTQRARTYGDLPPGKITEIEAINRDYRDLSEQIRENTQGIILAADREKLAFLEKEKRADLADILSPADLAEYDRRNSPSAGEIRNKLRYFEATEADFIALYQVQRDFDARYGRDNLSGEQSDRRKAALPELTEQFKTVLGAERFAEFEIMTDGNYSATRSTMTTLGLPTETAAKLVTIQRSANRRADSIRDDTTLSADQRATQLSALEKESIEKVSALLGTEENLAGYKKYSAGQWLSRLAPPVKKPSANPRAP